MATARKLIEPLEVHEVLTPEEEELEDHQGLRTQEPAGPTGRVGHADTGPLCLARKRNARQEHVDAVLEVGIDNYRMFDVQTSLQVLIKLIDPNTRQVIGRNSAKTFSVEDSPQTLLSQEAKRFKQLMTEMGAQMVASGFSGLGLPLKASFQPIPIDN